MKSGSSKRGRDILFNDLLRCRGSLFRKEKVSHAWFGFLSEHHCNMPLLARRVEQGGKPSPAIMRFGPTGILSIRPTLPAAVDTSED